MKQYYYFTTLFAIAMMVGGSLFAQTDCDPTGNGNPGLLDNGQGQGTGGDNESGALSWELLLNTTCPNQDNNLTLKDYDPANLCNNSSYLIPEVSHTNKVNVAIIDSGVRPTSPGKFNGSTLYSHRVSSTGVVTSGVSFPHPHGTYSAGVITGLVGRYADGNSYSSSVMELYDYQVLDGNLRTSLSAVVAAINHAVTKNVDLIALSIGFVPVECDGIDWKSPSSPLQAAITFAETHGVIVVTSAGNNSNNLADLPQYPAAYFNHNLVSVGALACEGEVPSSFSNYGKGIVDVFTTGAFVQVYYNGCFHSITGTSFATSIVAGKAALHLTKNSDMDKVLCLLRSQTKRFRGDQFSIYGIVDVPDVSEINICVNGETFDPNGGRGGNWPEDEKKSAAISNGSVSAKPFTVSASPNPFSDQLQLNIDNGEGKSVILLIDGQGRQVLNRQVSKPSVSLNLGHLPAGIYRVLVQNKAGSQTRTIVKK